MSWLPISVARRGTSTLPPGDSDCSASAESVRTRSTTRLSRFDVESTSVPEAEMRTAGVIIAPRTSPAAVFMAAMIRARRPQWRQPQTGTPLALERSEATADVMAVAPREERHPMRKTLVPLLLAGILTCLVPHPAEGEVTFGIRAGEYTDV